MLETGYVAVFIIGLLGGVHCAGMCGGIVGALSLNTAPARSPAWALHLAYNLGRISTYTLLGAALGALGGVSLLYNDLLPIQLGLYVAAQLMLILMGLYLLGQTRFMAPFERIGGVLWQRLSPLTRRFLPAQTPLHALPLGVLWGFIPCGLVYGVLATALVTGSALRGGLLMLAFGLGTLPNLFLAGFFLQRFRHITRHKNVRIGAGALVLGLGLFGLYPASTLGDRLWAGVVCAVPPIQTPFPLC
jgi:uncharacterized protein